MTQHKVAAGFVVLTLSLAIAFGGWWIARKVNYSLQYENMVRATVREMVKPEALKDQQ